MVTVCTDADCCTVDFGVEKPQSFCCSYDEPNGPLSSLIGGQQGPIIVFDKTLTVVGFISKDESDFWSK